MRRFVEGKGFTLTCEAPEDQLIADVDPGAIEQVVVNLIDKAVKYGGGEQRMIQVRIQKQEGQVILDVEDEGRGVPKDELTRVLERFHRVERVEQAHQPGTGLGLAIVKELVHAHGGTVALSNRAPRGLRVRVTLPRVIDGK